MSEHTPGPWRRTDRTIDIGDASADVSKRYEQSINVNRMADAKLIAAAPELLEALRAISGGDVMRKQGLQEGQYCSGDVLLEYQAIARAAIKRATE